MTWSWNWNRITYRGQDLPIEIGKSNENFKDKKLKCFNCEIYGHMAKDCQKPKKEKNTQKCYKCGQIGHIASDCETKQNMKKQSV